MWLAGDFLGQRAITHVDRRSRKHLQGSGMQQWLAADIHAAFQVEITEYKCGQYTPIPDENQPALL